jgi:hypothetical protein
MPALGHPKRSMSRFSVKAPRANHYAEMPARRWYSQSVSSGSRRRPVLYPGASTSMSRSVAADAIRLS